VSSGWVLLFLLVVAGLLASQADVPIVGAALLPFVVTLLAAHIDRESGIIARALVKMAARLLPTDKRADEYDEWMDHVEAAGEHGVLPLTRALSITFIAAPLLAVGFRIGRARRRILR